MILCKECGNPLYDNAAFCTNCGTVAADTLAEDPIVAPSPPSPVDVDIVHEAELVIQENDDGDGMTPETLPQAFSALDQTIVTLEPVAETEKHDDEPVQPDPPPAGSDIYSIVKVVLSVVFGTLVFGFVCAFIALVVLLPSNIHAIVINTDLAAVMDNTGLTEVILDGVNNTLSASFRLNEDDIRDLLKRENVSAEISNLVTGYISAATDGDLRYYMNSRAIVNALKAIEPDIRELFNYRLTSADYDYIAEKLDSQVNLEEFRINTMLETVNVSTAVPYALFSVYPLIITGLLFALIVFDIFILHRKRVAPAFLTNSIPIMAAGLVYLSAGFILRIYRGFFGNIDLGTISVYVGGVAHLFLTYGLILFAVGIILLVLFFVVRSIWAKRQETRSDEEKANSEKRTVAWRIACLATNSAVLVACAIAWMFYYSDVLYIMRQ